MPTEEQIRQWRVRLDPAGEELSAWQIAFVWVVLDEINVIRANAGLAPRTKQQVITALRNRAADLTVD